MIGFDGETLAAQLLFAEAEEAADGGATMRDVDPFAGRPPFELGRFRCGAEQRFDINAVVHFICGCCCVLGHWLVPFMDIVVRVDHANFTFYKFDFLTRRKRFQLLWPGFGALSRQA